MLNLFGQISNNSAISINIGSETDCQSFNLNQSLEIISECQFKE